MNDHNRPAPPAVWPMLVLLFFVSGCAEEPPATDEAPAEPLPELARVAGAQDLWAFPFGLSAARSDVEEAYGTPRQRRVDETRGGTAASIVEWEYDGLTLSFFVRNDGSEEYLVSARVRGPSAPLRGPVQLGAAVEQVREAFGEPRVASDDRLVYFFSETTVEFTLEDGRVSAVTLGRALP